MEYSYRISELFPEEICVVSNDLIPVGCPALNQLGPKVVKERLTEILDTMGKASAEAQSLHSIITNAEKLRNGDHKLYVFCDFTSNRVVGLLKIGKKKLFLFDDSGTQHELNPLCILDFYIHESRQRKGAGKYLFDYMLREEQIPVEHFAVDRPSDKLIFFLRKHYGLTKVLPQVNNFVLFDGFFSKRSDYAGKKARWTGLDQAPERALEGGIHTKHQMSRMEDSLDYNSEPLIHLRNGHQLPPNYTQRRHQSQMGGIMHPTYDPSQLHTNGNGNGHNHWSTGNNMRNGNPVKTSSRDVEIMIQRQLSSTSIMPSLADRHDDRDGYQYIRQMQSENQFRDLRSRSRSRDEDQNHELLW